MFSIVLRIPQLFITLEPSIRFRLGFQQNRLLILYFLEKSPEKVYCLSSPTWNFVSLLSLQLIRLLSKSLLNVNKCDLLWRNREQVGATSFSLSKNQQRRLFLSDTNICLATCFLLRQSKW